MVEPVSSKLALTLSGGGFRATIFHLGVVRFLRDAQLLDRVTRIGAVSGGSVLAAHLVLNWERYLDDFDDTEMELIEFIRSDVRGRITRRWLFHALSLSRLAVKCLAERAWAVHRSELLVREYERLFKGATLAHLAQANRPQVFFHATSMSTGNVCSFGGSGFVDCEHGIEQQMNCPELKVSVAVAASSAFPPAFPPVQLSNKMFGCSVPELQIKHYLTDGGVFDDLGVDRLLAHCPAGGDPGEFIMSDAEPAFNSDLAGSFRWLFPRSVRATELLMKRVSAVTYELLRLKRVPAYPVSIAHVVEAPDDPAILPPALQQMIGSIRSDLDMFSELEIECIYLHGYTVARYQLGHIANFTKWTAKKPSTEGTTPLRTCNDTVRRWIRTPAVPGMERLHELAGGRNRPWRVWDWRDWASWANLALIGFWFSYVLPQVLSAITSVAIRFWHSLIQR